MIIPTSQELNYVTVNGVRSPGRAEITGLKVPYKWNVQESHGKDGASTTFVGRGIARFTLTVTLWLREHFVEWELFSKLLGPPTPSKPLVVKMGHPLLSQADVKDVGIESCGVPQRQSNGMWLVTIECLEFRKLKDALVTPRGAIPDVAKGKPIPPKTEADLAIEATKANLAVAYDRARRAGG
jgi:hypothetical protein